MSEKSLRNGANHGFWVPAKALPSASGSLTLEPMRKRSRAEQSEIYTLVAGQAKWKFRLMMIHLTRNMQLIVVLADGQVKFPSKGASLPDKCQQKIQGHIMEEQSDDDSRPIVRKDLHRPLTFRDLCIARNAPGATPALGKPCHKPTLKDLSDFGKCIGDLARIENPSRRHGRFATVQELGWALSRDYAGRP